ncbi:MAG TPA: hypothetical protein VMI54_21170 [Polyangiaceae bacterium]|nr:hypothetical protein [Polyangiaceae bacterium]
MTEGALRPERAFVSHAPEPKPTARGGGPAWVYAYIVVQLVCQLCLLVPELKGVRVVVRTAAFGTSLLFLVVAPRGTPRGGAVRVLALVALTIFLIAMFNPLGGDPLAVVAHFTFCVAVISPLFWVGRLDLPTGTLGRLLLLLWTFHSLGALVGVLQVYFPAYFLPDLATLMQRTNLLIRLSSGDWVPRPTGLTDAPGGASVDGIYAALLGTGVTMLRPFRFARFLGITSTGLGLMCLYLCEVRAEVVVAIVSFVSLIALFVWSGRASRGALLLILLGAVGFVGFYFASGVGGDMMKTRLESLIAADPGTVYYNSRGNMLEQAFVELLPRYPLGAGLGHWGMMNSYFGSAEQEIGSEIQVGGWVLDGGLPLLLVYPAAVLAAIVYACRSSRTPDPTQATWASIVAAYSVGSLALCFSYPVFMGTAGLEFWLTNAVLMQEIRLRPLVLRRA